MTNYIDESGLHTETITEIMDGLVAAFQGIYGTDINVGANSPDGQMLGLFAQAKADILDCIAQVYNGFNPTNAVGVRLDQLCAINGVIRVGATYTRTAVTLTSDRVVSLLGLDTNPDTPFTVADTAGTKFFLEESASTSTYIFTVSSANATIGAVYSNSTQTFTVAATIAGGTTLTTTGSGNPAASGTLTKVSGTGDSSITFASVRNKTTLNFRSENPGAVATTVGTITTISTITLGVISCTNANSAIYSGVDEETDPALRARRERSLALQARGYLDGLYGAILATDGVLEAKVYENATDTEDGHGVPPYSIWVVVDCPNTTAAKAIVADTIYQKRSAGCGMKGDVSVDVEQANGENFAVKFDFPIYDDLYIKLCVQSLDPSHEIDIDTLKTYLYDNLIYKIYDPADITPIITLIKEFDPLAVVRIDLGGGVSSNNTAFYSFIYPGTIQTRWLLSTARINLILET